MTQTKHLSQARAWLLALVLGAGCSTSDESGDDEFGSPEAADPGDPEGGASGGSSAAGITMDCTDFFSTSDFSSACFADGPTPEVLSSFSQEGSCLYLLGHAPGLDEGQLGVSMAWIYGLPAIMAQAMEDARQPPMGDLREIDMADEAFLESFREVNEYDSSEVSDHRNLTFRYRNLIAGIHSEHDLGYPRPCARTMPR